MGNAHEIPNGILQLLATEVLENCLKEGMDYSEVATFLIQVASMAAEMAVISTNECQEATLMRAFNSAMEHYRIGSVPKIDVKGKIVIKSSKGKH